MRYWFILTTILLAASQPAHAVYEPTQPAPQPQYQQPAQPIPPVQPMQPAENVEEPDATDENSMGQPGEQIPGETEKVPVPAPVPPQASQASQAQPSGDAGYDRVVLQGLNKVTARAQTIEAPIGSVERFGTIEIVAHRCWKSAPEERPENAALLEISEIKQGETPKQIFLGWMFSSSPGISSLEHPFYDVTVVRCEKAVAEAAPPPPAAPEKPAHKKAVSKSP